MESVEQTEYKHIDVYKSVDDILKNKFPNSTYTKLDTIDEGGNNIIEKYEIKDTNEKTKKIIVRQSMETLLKKPETAIQKFINENNTKRKHSHTEDDVDNEQVDIEKIEVEHIEKYVNRLISNSEKNRKLANRDRFNWENADANHISPKLYFYGYLTKETEEEDNTKSIYRTETQTYHEIYIVIVSEAYDMSLADFYKKNKKQGEPQHIGYQNKKNNTELQDIDINIANQLIDLLTTLHNDSKLICFDIKPANFVINITNETEFDVKMIDLDKDWCHDYSELLTIIYSEHAPRNLIKQLSIMILANHFFWFLKWNIFQKYIEENKTKFEENHDALFSLFCEVDDKTNLATKLSETYQYMNKHYLYHENLERTGRYGLPLQPPEICKTLFDDMFNDMQLLKPPEPSVSPRPPLAPSKKRGGKLKKKKRTNKNKKRKTKSKRKTKRKRT